MKKMNEKQMREIDGGFGYRCSSCWKWFWTKRSCNSHILSRHGNAGSWLNQFYGWKCKTNAYPVAV